MHYLENFYERALHWIIAHGPRIIIAVLFLIIAQIAVRFIRKWLKALMDKSHIDPSVKTFLGNLFVALFQIIIFVILLKIVGVQMTVFASILAGATVAIGLALSGTMQNFASGVLILLLKPYRVGDNIITQGQEGTVSSIQLFYTIITTFDNKTVIVPNSKLSNEIILNLSREGKRRIDIDLKFKYTMDFEKIKNVVIKTFHSFNNILAEPAVRVGISKLDTDSFQVTVNAWSPAHGFEDARLAINQQLMIDLKMAGLLGAA